MAPEGLRYTEAHEWVRIEGQWAFVGITDFAQRKLGDIVFVELPETGKAVKTGEVLGAIESVKAASEVYAPVSGSIAETNEQLVDSPGTINKDPYGDGWIAKIVGANPKDLANLMDSAAYDALVAGEEDK